MAVLIPTKSPLVLTKAPPELPGFMAASVCIKDSMPFLLFNMLILLAFALTIPAVTVELRLNGLPTAKTHSPTLMESESLKVRCSKF